MHQLSVVISLIALSAALLAGCANHDGNTSQQQRAAQPTSAAAPAKPSGAVQITFNHVAFIGDARGNGVLNFQGKQYPFEVTGLSVRGVAAARVRATGEIYGLNTPADLAGAYVQEEQSDSTLGNAGGGGLRLKNEHGVVMRLDAPLRGAALTLGADAARVSMRQ